MELVDGLYQVTNNYLCAGFVVDGGVIVDCAPILKNKIEHWKTVAKLITAKKQKTEGENKTMAVGNSLWGVSEGGGENAGIKECVFEVQAVEPTTAKTGNKKNILWKGINLTTNKPMQKTFGIGTDWRFDFGTGKYVDEKGNDQRQVNSGCAFGILLSSIIIKPRETENSGPMIDLSTAKNDLMQFPQGPLAIAPWIGTRWHMVEVTINYGMQDKVDSATGVTTKVPILNKMLFPIRYLGKAGTPMPVVNWVFGPPQMQSQPPSNAMSGYGQGTMQAPGYGQGIAPQAQSQVQPSQQQPQYAPQQQYAPQPMQQPQYQQPQYQQPQYQAPVPQPQQPQYSPQPPQQQYAPQQPQQHDPNQYQQQAPQQPQYQQAPQQPQYAPNQYQGGGPTAGGQFPGQ